MLARCTSIIWRVDDTERPAWRLRVVRRLHCLGSMLTRAFTIPLTWGELLKRTARETIEDDCLSLAAELAYYFFLAVFPAVLFLLAVASFFPLYNLTDDVARLLGPFVTSEVLQLIQDQMRRLANADSGGILTVGVAGALWGSSTAMVSIVASVNKAYDIADARPWWKVRLTAMWLTIALAYLRPRLAVIDPGGTVACDLSGSDRRTRRSGGVDMEGPAVAGGLRAGLDGNRPGVPLRT